MHRRVYLNSSTPFQKSLENNAMSNTAEAAGGADYSAAAARILSQIWGGMAARISSMLGLILAKVELVKKVKIEVKPF